MKHINSTDDVLGFHINGDKGTFKEEGIGIIMGKNEIWTKHKHKNNFQLM